MSAVACESCGAVHLDVVGTGCPACGSGPLSPTTPKHPASPERLVPRSIDTTEAERKLADAASEVWFAVDDLDPKRLASRLVRVWWPSWLVDVDAAGIWEAEAGFDYPVESSQEVYGPGGWTTRKVTETRTRWERRTGRLRRRYDNLTVAGLAKDPAGDDVPAPSVAWTPDATDGAIRLPDRSPDEQWPDALEVLRDRAGEECARACGADHVRELFLDVDASGAHWSLLLRPGYTTWYTDDDGRTHVLVVDGSTGKVSGRRLASVARGRKWALGWFAAGGVLVATSGLLGVVGLLIWFLLPVAGVGLVIGALVGLVGIWPLVGPARWNQQELAR